MPRLVGISEIRFYRLQDVPDDAEVVDEKSTAAWRGYHEQKMSTGVGYRDGWVEQFSPTDERSVAAKVIWRVKSDAVTCPNCGKSENQYYDDDAQGLVEVKCPLCKHVFEAVAPTEGTNEPLRTQS